MDENYRIQQLIESKSFDELSNEEKTIVLSEITEDEYTNRKSVVYNTRLFLSTEVNRMQPADKIKQRAMAMLMERKNNEKKSLLSMIFQYKIPAFIPAAAAVLLLIMLPFAFNSEKKTEYIASVTDTIQKTVYKTDTVILEKEVVKEVKVPVVKYVTTETPRTTQISNNNQGTDRVVKTDPATIVSNTQNQLKKHLSQMGQSSGDTDAFDALIKMRDTLIYEP
ncbi:MAG: hypothetical protein ACHQF2_06685 [Flavobacteriales bacterium]